ncbi:MAG: hypothetical protein ACPHL9_05175 [Limisphaerales bacterium]
MKLKSLLIAGAVAAAFMAPEYATARPKPHKPKPDLTDKKDGAKENAKEGGKERPKVDREKIKERLKAAFEKRKNHHKDAKSKGHKIKHQGRAFGKLVRDDDKIKELREAFEAAAKEHHEKVKGLHKQLKDASDEDKEGLREQLKNLRKDWFEGMKGNREEVRERIKEIREEFKNKRDDVIDANEEDGDKPGE